MPRWLKTLMAACAAVVSIGGAAVVVVRWWGGIVGLVGVLTISDAKAQEDAQDRRTREYVETRMELVQQKLDAIREGQEHQRKQLGELIYILMRRGGLDGTDDHKP